MGQFIYHHQKVLCSWVGSRFHYQSYIIPLLFTQQFSYQINEKQKKILQTCLTNDQNQQTEYNIEEYARYKSPLWALLLDYHVGRFFEVAFPVRLRHLLVGCEGILLNFADLAHQQCPTKVSIAFVGNLTSQLHRYTQTFLLASGLHNLNDLKINRIRSGIQIDSRRNGSQQEPK